MPSSITTTAIQAIQIPVTLLSILQLDGSGLLYPQQTEVKNNSIMDYIVVGAGSAGCVVATRLVEANFSVLLLEYGDDPPLTALAAGLFVLIPKSSSDYDYMSTFDPYAAGGQGNYTTLTAGKMLGGSDSMNHFIHTRGCHKDFDEWANITGDDSWSYENFLPYFIKSERLDDAEIISQYPEYHGTEGPMGISRQTSERADPYLEALDEVGFPTVLDLNANISMGFTQSQFMLADKVRQTPARSYLKRVMNNSNLYVSKNTRVTKVIFEDKVAKAVEAVYDGKTYIFQAAKEIIISAGVYNSPQILQLSGVGPKEHLDEMGIEVLADLPVGDGFTDQVSTTLVYKTKSHLPLVGLTKVDPDVTQIPFPVIVGSASPNEESECPDYQVYALLLASDTPFVTLACRNTFWNRADICDSWQADVVDRDAFYAALANVNPKSRGTVRLNSTDPFDDPVIKTGYYDNCEDETNMLKYVYDFIKIGNSTFFKDVSAEIVGLDLAECSDKEPNTDSFWRCYIKNRSFSPYHATGTCAMGSVVNGSLKLIGFDNIRVIDASVIPRTPSGAPNAAVIAIAEKGADMIINRK